MNELKTITLSLLDTMLENDLDDCFSFSEDEAGDSCQYLYIDGNRCECCQARHLIAEMERQQLCPSCGDDRTGKGSLIVGDKTYCNENCYKEASES